MDYGALKVVLLLIISSHEGSTENNGTLESLSFVSSISTEFENTKKTLEKEDEIYKKKLEAYEKFSFDELKKGETYLDRCLEKLEQEMADAYDEETTRAMDTFLFELVDFKNSLYKLGNDTESIVSTELENLKKRQIQENKLYSNFTKELINILASGPAKLCNYSADIKKLASIFMRNMMSRVRGFRQIVLNQLWPVFTKIEKEISALEYYVSTAFRMTEKCESGEYCADKWNLGSHYLKTFPEVAKLLFANCRVHPYSSIFEDIQFRKDFKINKENLVEEISSCTKS